jgi:hypothetical protein
MRGTDIGYKWQTVVNQRSNAVNLKIVIVQSVTDW